MEFAPLTAAVSAPSPRRGAASWPRVTLACIAVLALVQAIPGLGEGLLFDRDAIRQGEFWRVVTAHAVHYSWTHLWGNLAVLAVAGLWVEPRGSRALTGVLVAASVAVGGAVWMFEPGIVEFAGASGVTVAVIVYAAGCAWRDGGRARWVAFAVLLGVAAKLVAESNGWRWRDPTADGFVVVASSHMAGAVIGALSVVASSVSGRVLRREPA